MNSKLLSSIAGVVVLGLAINGVAQTQEGAASVENESSMETNQEANQEAKNWEKWFEEDFEEKALNVNEGKLNFLASPPTDKIVHSVTNTITIAHSSLDSHWVALRQCHKNLDPVPETEIVYQYKNMRDLRIEHYYGIGNAFIDKQSVQLKGVEKHASICVIADVQILRPGKDNTYKLLNGPYFRKFLDGYYPFHVTVVVNYPASELTLTSTRPEAQNGFDVRDTQGTLNMDAWFEGELLLEANFTAIPN